MPIFNETNYPLVTPVGDDTVLLRQTASGRIKSTLVSALANAASPLQLAATMADLKAIATDGLSDGATALLGGYYEDGDGGGGFFRWDQTSSETANNGTIIAPDDGSGRWFRNYSGPLNVLWFGAIGDGATDARDAFQATIAAAWDALQGVYIPPADYSLASAINVAVPVEIFSESVRDNTLRLISAFNGAMFNITAQCRFTGISFSGTNSDAASSQCAALITSTNNVVFTNCFFINFYDHVKISGTCFYLSFTGCEFYSARRSWLYGVSATAQGIDMRMTNCRGSSATSTMQYGFYFSGLGSIVMADCTFTPVQCTVGGFHVEAMASLAGVQMFSNTVMETNGVCPAFTLKGTALLPCKFFMFSNCYFGGGGATSSGIPVILLGNAQFTSFTGCYITGNDGGIDTDYQAIHTIIDGCNFQTLGLPVSARHTTAGSAITSVSYAITDCIYTGALAFLYLPNLSAGQIGYVSASGGQLGVAATQLDLPAAIASIFYIRTGGLRVTGLANYADNAAAISAGLALGQFYRTTDTVKVVH